MEKKILLCMLSMALVLGLMESCVSPDWTALELKKIEGRISYSVLGHTDEVVPGALYYVSLTATDQRGKRILVSPFMALLSSPNGSFVVGKPGIAGIPVTLNPDLFGVIATGGYLLNAGVEGDAYVEKGLSWPVNWNRQKVMDKSGAPGQEGSPGAPGSAGTGSAAGGAGADGGTGSNGASGPKLDLLAFRYSLKGLELGAVWPDSVLVLYDVEAKTLTVLGEGPCTLYARGGNGGNGGTGGVGGPGGSFRNPATGEILHAPAGPSGLVGRAGYGGDGGQVNLRYADPALSPWLRVDVSGGDPGMGRGSARAGKDGTAVLTRLGADEFKVLLAGIGVAGFDPARVIWP